MRKILISAMIGNALEWYDFVLYVQFSSIISKLFFPMEDHFNSMLATFGVFAAGFVMRPLGGILFGWIGDRYGRKISLISSILLMAVPTALIGILPTYATIGVVAPILLTLIRLMQGLALGGGFSGCMAFLVEYAPENRRGAVGSASMFSLGAGVLLGILVSSLFVHLIGNEAFEAWGWRLPFIISIFIGMIAFYIRSYVHESPLYLQAKESGNISDTPVKEVLTNNFPALIRAIGVYLTVTVPFYTLTAYFNNFLQKYMHYPISKSLLINGIAIFACMIAIPFSGALSDKVGRKKILTITAIILCLISYPVFLLIGAGGMTLPILGQALFGIILGIYLGPVPAFLVEIFPTRIRFTGLALSYNTSAALFGGTVPMVYIWMVEKTTLATAPAFYIMIFTILTVISIYGYRDKYNQSLA